jgi:hypothetical protein
LSVLSDGKIEDIEALVQIDFIEMFQLSEEQLIKKLTLIAVGDEILGKVDFHFSGMYPCGVVDCKYIIFKVIGELHKPLDDEVKEPEKKKKAKKPVKRKATKKKTTRKK